MHLKDGSVAVIYSLFCIHHIPRIRDFFKEALRVLEPGGLIVAIDPYWSPLGALFFRYFCSEPYAPDAKRWEFDGQGPMSCSNQALSYILLKRDRALFEAEFPRLRVVHQEPLASLDYLCAGALWGRQFFPTSVCRLAGKLEERSGPLKRLVSVFHSFVYRKQ